MNADKKPVTEPGAATSAPTTIDTSNDSKKPAADASPAPDVSTLTREQLEARVKALTDSLAAANTESEYFREQWTELKLRDEALGVQALTADESKTQDKLVQAVKEMYQNEMKRREAVVLLDKLLNTSDKMLQSAPNYDPKVRAEYEVASRSAKALLAGHSGAAVPIGTTLADGRILSTRPEINAVMLNLGKNQGVKEGMNFLVYQDDVEIGMVKVMLTRDLVSAASVMGLKPGAAVRMGDRVAIQTQH